MARFSINNKVYTEAGTLSPFLENYEASLAMAIRFFFLPREGNGTECSFCPKKFASGSEEANRQKVAQRTAPPGCLVNRKYDKPDVAVVRRHNVRLPAISATVGPPTCLRPGAPGEGAAALRLLPELVAVIAS